MRAYEFIIEAKDGKMDKHHKNVQGAVHKMRDDGGYDRTYHQNRVMMAMAMADGKSKKAVKGMDVSSWVEKYNTAHPYTDIEHNMIHQALKTIPSEHEVVSHDKKSREDNDVHKQSPVPKRKPNKHGV